MIDAVPEKKVVKLNITIDDDINLILDAISKVEAAFILLILPEGNDLANSPIGLKALRKKTYEKGKRMILVVPSGPSYELAKRAGFIATTQQDAVTSDVWQTAIQQYEEYHHANVGKNSMKEVPNKIDKGVEYLNPVSKELPVPEIVSSGMLAQEEAEKKAEIEEKRNADIVPNAIEMNYGEESKTEEISLDNANKTIGKVDATSDSSETENSSIVAETKKTFGNFFKKLPFVKAEPTPEERTTPLEIPKTTPVVASNQPKNPRDVGMKITGMDFSKMIRPGSTALYARKPQQKSVQPQTIQAPPEVNTFHPDVTPKKIGGVSLPSVAKKKGLSPVAKFALFGVLGFLLIALSGFFAYYIYFPTIRIELQVQSTPETVVDKVLATSAVSSFDANKKEIPLIKETVEKNASWSFEATEKGVDGTKATGTVNLDNSDTADKTIPSGTLLVSGNLKFATQNAIVIPGKSGGALGHGSVNVIAADLGEEYNIPISSSFTVTGFPTVTGGNTAAFKGGTKRTFTIVGQTDVDKATKELQEELEKQGTAELMYMNRDTGYVYMPDSVKTTIKDKATVTPAVGTEVKSTDEQPNISMNTKTTALYYQKTGLDKLSEKMLLEKYRAEKNLSATDAALTTIEQLVVKVDKITIDKDEKVTIDFTATGLATSKLSTEKIKNDVVGKKWPEMLSIVSQISTLSQQPVVKFFPSWMPDSLRYVPKETARIEVSVKVVAPEAQAIQ